MPAPCLVSVIVPTHNRPQMLQEALKSIRALEGPDLKFEIIVGDNGGLPQTRQIARKFDCLFIHTSGKGAAAARNVAMSRASGEFIAFLDDDDVWLSGCLRAQLAHFKLHPEVQAVFGQVTFTDHNLKPLKNQWKATIRPGCDLFMTMMNGYFPQLGATVIRREVLDRVGLMDEDLIGDEDWDWQMRIVSQYPAALIDEPGVLFRGKAPGSADDLLIMRVGYTRKVFMRHYKANRKRWSSPAGVLRSYFRSVQHYYLYFMQSAEQHALNGHPNRARRMLFQAFKSIPSRFVRQLICVKQVRDLAFGTISRGPAQRAQTSD